MLSPRSRGKGNRRVPGRDGGRRKKKRVVWRKQATHAVDDPSQLAGELVTLKLVGDWKGSAATCIYRFDQHIAPLGIQYYAEFTGRRWCPAFKIMVSVDHAEKVSAVVSQLEKR